MLTKKQRTGENMKEWNQGFIAGWLTFMVGLIVSKIVGII